MYKDIIQIVYDNAVTIFLLIFIILFSGILTLCKDVLVVEFFNPNSREDTL